MKFLKLPWEIGAAIFGFAVKIVDMLTLGGALILLIVVAFTACWQLNGPAIIYYAIGQLVITGSFFAYCTSIERAAARNKA